MEIQIVYCLRLISGTFNCRRKVRIIVADHTCLDHLGLSYKHSGQIDKAIEYGEKALRLVQQLGDQNLHAQVLGNLGGSCRVKGDFQKAMVYREQALAIFRLLHDEGGEVMELVSTAAVLSDLGRMEDALSRLREALDISRRIGAHREEVTILDNIRQLQQMMR